MGARPMARKITEMIRVPLSKKILFEQVALGSTVQVDFVDGAITFEVRGERQAVGRDGIIRVNDVD
jgi:ATP-dependent Clp protease ATP-binding subunit ClpA